MRKKYRNRFVSNFNTEESIQILAHQMTIRNCARDMRFALNYKIFMIEKLHGNDNKCLFSNKIIN